MRHCILDKLTNFELAGLSSTIIALGDMLWLVKDALHLSFWMYGIILSILVAGLIVGLVSMYRHHEKHWSQTETRKNRKGGE